PTRRSAHSVAAKHAANTPARITASVSVLPTRCRIVVPAHENAARAITAPTMNTTPLAGPTAARSAANHSAGDTGRSAEVAWKSHRGRTTQLRSQNAERHHGRGDMAGRG